MKACRSRVASVKRGRNGTNKSDDEKKEQKNEEHRGSGYAQMSLRASRAATIEKPEKMQEATGQEKQRRAREGWRERERSDYLRVKTGAAYKILSREDL